MEKRVDKMLPDNSREARPDFDSFWTFVEATCPDLLTYEHAPKLIEAAERVVQGDIDRLMVLMPPRYYKSTTFSRLLPAYKLLRDSTENVGLASYGAQLAWDLSDDARDYYKEMGGQTSDSTDAKREWETADGGKMWAGGLGGSLTGWGYHLGIVDDPMKPKHARSRKYIEEFRNWWPETWHNRQESGAKMIIVMQRLGSNDPIDFLLRREVGKGDAQKAPENWHILAFDEVHSDEPFADYDGPKGFPKTCTLIEDNRQTGEILAPSLFDRDEVMNRQRGAGENKKPQRQQRSGDESGKFWDKGLFEVFGDPSNPPREDVPPSAYKHGKDWDTAYTADEENSASAYTQSASTKRDQYIDVWIYGCDWRWVEFPELVNWIARLEGPHHVEAKASGKSAAQTLSNKGLPVKEVEVEGGDKYARANSAKGDIASNEIPDEGRRGGIGKVYVHAAVWEKFFEGDMQGLKHISKQDLIGGGENLDLNDTFVQAIHRHSGSGQRSGGGANIPL